VLHVANELVEHLHPPQARLQSAELELGRFALVLLLAALHADDAREVADKVGLAGREHGQ
jgi:hypothetical protein